MFPTRYTVFFCVCVCFMPAGTHTGKCVSSELLFHCWEVSAKFFGNLTQKLGCRLNFKFNPAKWFKWTMKSHLDSRSLIWQNSSSKGSSSLCIWRTYKISTFEEKWLNFRPLGNLAVLAGKRGVCRDSTEFVPSRTPVAETTPPPPCQRLPCHVKSFSAFPRVEKIQKSYVTKDSIIHFENLFLLNSGKLNTLIKSRILILN